jgi:hypothetical protein
MKKLSVIIVGLALLLTIILVTDVEASPIDYQTDLGNSLSDFEFDLNTHVTDFSELEIYDIIIPSRFELMAEDDELELYFEEETLAIAVRVKDNGYVYSSYDFTDYSIDTLTNGVKNPIKSGVSIDAYYRDGTPVSRTYLDINNETDARIAVATITELANGFTMNVDFNDYELKIRFDVTVLIEEGELKVSIPYESIEEYNENLFTNDWTVDYHLLRSIRVFPYFGATSGEENGYAVIPDGSGMIINLEDDPENKATFNLELYGTDLGYMSSSIRTRALSVKPVSRLTMPIYGMIHDEGNTAFYVISESGDTYAKLHYSSADIVNSYHRMYFNYVYRDSYEQYQSRSDEDSYRIAFQDEPNAIDVEQRYVFLSGSDASYVGMAKDYAQQLETSGELSETAERTIYDTIPTKIDFIGSELTNGIISVKTVPITRYLDVKSTIETLLEDGYTDLITTYKTYNSALAGYRLDIERMLGGSNDLYELIEFLRENDIDFGYYLDYTRSYDDYSNDHAQTLSKRDIYHIEYSNMSYLHYVNDTSNYVEYAQDDIKVLNDYGISSVAINGLDRAIYTSFDDGIRSSANNVDDIRQMLDTFNNANISTSLYLPDSYLYRFTETYYNAPLSSTEYAAQSSAIPFVQLVLSGYMDFYSDYLNFISDEQYSLMRMVEYGVYPSYILSYESAYELKKTLSSNIYISNYDVLESRIDGYYQFISGGLSLVIGQEMINHEFLDVGVSRVTYANGVSIVLNYTTKDITVDGLIVSSGGYEVIE